jgi:hypothetical protein
MREEDHAMTPDQFIDAVADASNNPTPEKLERVRRALPLIGTRPGGITFPRAVVDALWRRARGFPFDPTGAVGRAFVSDWGRRLRDLLTGLGEPQAVEAWRRGLGLPPQPRRGGRREDAPEPTRS